MSIQRGRKRSAPPPKNLRNERYDLLYKGVTGRSAYEEAVANGYSGTAVEWLLSLQATDGPLTKENIESVLTGEISSHTHPGGLDPSYETVSKNLKGYPYVITYNGDDIDYITYDLGGGLSIVKTFNYTVDDLTSLILSGDTPSGIDLTKTLSYTGDDLTSITYS